MAVHSWVTGYTGFAGVTQPHSLTILMPIRMYPTAWGGHHGGAGVHCYTLTRLHDGARGYAGVTAGTAVTGHAHAGYGNPVDRKKNLVRS